MSVLSLLKNPLDESKRTAIVNICQDVLTVFTAEYLKCFKNELIDRIMSEANEATPSNYLLSERPIDTSPLKTGYLVKQGGNRKNWKRRWFIVKYNHEVEYWESEEAYNTEGARPKGTIACRGLRVIPDVSLEGHQFLFELRHSVKRCWFLEAESEEDKEDWIRILKQCTRKARVPLNEDPVMREAFITAYHATRWSMGIWDSIIYWITCPEGEQLGLLISCKLERELLSDVYAALPNGGSGKIGHLARKSVQKTVNSIVGGAVSTSWKAVSGQVADIKPTLEDGVRKVLGPIAEAESGLRIKIKNAILDTLQPILDATVTPVITKVFDILCSSIVESYTVLIQIYDEIINDLRETAPDKFSQAMKRVYGQIFYPWNNKLWPARKCLNGCREKLEVLNDLVREISPYHIISELGDSLVRLMNNAMFTLEDEMQGGADLDTAAASVRQKLINDCRETLKDTSHQILYDLVSNPLRQKAIPSVTSIVEPLDSMIPDPVKEFVSVSKSLNQLLDDLLHEIISDSTREASEGALCDV
ncbi:hypothetical protein GEMRC1_006056 [Eukaryota sp. GEM-RC1]